MIKSLKILIRFMYCEYLVKICETVKFRFSAETSKLKIFVLHLNYFRKHT
jgi:hypothetical protein